MKFTVFRKAQSAVIFCIALTLALAADSAQAATFVTVGGEAVIEAESFTRRGGSVGGQWSVMTDLAGSNGAYIESGADDPSTLAFSSNIISAQYDIDFRQTGTYYIHLRTYALDTSQNGFFATIDGTQIDYGDPAAFYIYVKPLNNWNWYTDGGGEGDRGHLLSFEITEQGVKTLAIYRRDKSSKIDQLWITQTTSSPQDVGFLPLTDPNTFIVTEDPEICNDGLDNNNNGLMDCDDPGCEAYAGCFPESDCENGLDDDLDGLADCDDTDCSVLDSDNDTVADCLDAYPQDSNEWQDTDLDGTGDNADTDDDNDAIPDAEEKGMNGDVPDYDGNSDGEPDSRQNSVASLHSNTGADYLTFSIVGGQGTFTWLTASDASTAPEGTVFGYDLFDLGMSVSQDGASAQVVLHMPTGETTDAIFLLGPTPDNSQDHWYRFDFDGETGAEINSNVVTLHFVDGLRGDHDLTSNGTVTTLMGPADLEAVVDPPPPEAVVDPPPPTSGGGGGGGGCFIQSTR